MKHIELGLLWLAIVLAVPASAQETFRTPESLGYRPLSVAEASAGLSEIKPVAEFAAYEHAYNNGGNLEEEAPPKWQRTSTYTAFGTPEEFQRDVSNAGVKQSLTRLRTQIESSSTFAPAAIGAAGATENTALLLKSLLSKIDDYIAKVDATKAGDAIPIPEAEFQETSGALGDFSTDVCFFLGTENQIVLAGKKKGAPTAEVPIATKTTVYYATLRQAIEIRAVTDRIQITFRAVKEKPFERVSAHLSDINLGWSNYLDKGFSQYPWESILNSYVTPKIFGAFAWDNAPHDQIVFLHPELGFELDTRSAQGASAQVALMIHALGYIHYFGDTRDWYLGASGTVTFSDQDFGLGVGPTLHLGWAHTYSVVPHISIGAYWQDFETGGRGPIVGFSLDFWRLLNKTSEQSFYASAFTGLK